MAAQCRQHGIALALLPGDGGDDPRLRALSTVDAAAWTRLDACLRQGGPANLAAALRLAAHLAGLGPDDGAQPVPVPACGVHDFGGEGTGPVAAVVFYRSHLLAGDIAPVQAVAEALRARGLTPRGLYVASMKDPQAVRMVADTLRAWRPAVVLNATGFSARQGDAASRAGCGGGAGAATRAVRQRAGWVGRLVSWPDADGPGDAGGAAGVGTGGC